MTNIQVPAPPGFYVCYQPGRRVAWPQGYETRLGAERRMSELVEAGMDAEKIHVVKRGNMADTLRTDYFGYRVTCTTCGVTKKPWGRSVPLDSYYCDSDCHGYMQEPLPSNLWPGESEADFGFKVVR
jgi:hypothetical protein